MTTDSVTRLAQLIKELTPKAFDKVCEIEAALGIAFPLNSAVLALSAACAARKVLQRRRK